MDIANEFSFAQSVRAAGRSLVHTMLVTISLLVSAVAAAYIYLVWNFNYWKKRHVPGPDPKPLVGNFPAFILRTRTVMEEMDEIYKFVSD